MTKPDANEVIWRDGALKLSLSPFVSDQWLDYVSGVWFGPRKRRYQRRNIREQVARFENPRFLSLTYSGKLVGSYLLDLQSLALDDTPWCGVYRGLLSVDETFRDRKLGAAIVDATLTWLHAFADEHPHPVMTYGCIDAANERSLALLASRGMNVLGELSTQLKYRQFKKRRLPPIQLSDNLSTKARQQLVAGFTTPLLTESDPGFGTWLTYDDGKHPPVAARIACNVLNLAPMKGVAGFVTETLMPWFPPGLKRFNPRHFRYVSVSDAVFANDSPQLWDAFVEHLMVEHDCHFVAITLNHANQAHGARIAASGDSPDVVVVGRSISGELPTELAVRLAARDL
ncbi:MAG: hypothetical protein AAAFM81_01925 [Pseudomonadota bacterium]